METKTKLVKGLANSEKNIKNKDFKMHNPRIEVDLLIEELKHPELL